MLFNFTDSYVFLGVTSSCLEVVGQFPSLIGNAAVQEMIFPSAKCYFVGDENTDCLHITVDEIYALRVFCLSLS